MGRRFSISVVVPVYNSEPILPKLVSRLHPVLDSLADRYELVLVNDGSHDKSWAVIARLADEHDWIRGIDLMRNYGQHNALLAGIRAAQYEVIVTIDDDLQHPPEEIPQLLAKLDEGYDVVYGTPQQEQHGLWRDLASQVTKLALQTTMGVEIARNVSAYRAFRAQVQNAFSNYQGSFVSVDVLLSWGTARFAPGGQVQLHLSQVGHTCPQYDNRVQHMAIETGQLDGFCVHAFRTRSTAVCIGTLPGSRG